MDKNKLRNLLKVVYRMGVVYGINHSNTDITYEDFTTKMEETINPVIDAIYSEYPNDPVL